MILKLQQSIEPPGRCLVYNKNRSVISELDLFDEIARLMGSRPKIFVEAEIDGEGILQIDKEVDDPGW